MIDVEALARELGCEYHGYDYGVCASCTAQAERLLDADWLPTLIKQAEALERVRELCDAEEKRVDEMNARLTTERGSSPITGRAYRVSPILGVAEVRAALERVDRIEATA